MPIWSNRVPEDPRGPAFPILRTPPHGRITGIVTSDDIIGCFTHFYKGRTMPCEGDDCEACRSGVPYRWHAYLSAFTKLTGVHFIFESTAQSAEKFVDYRNLAGTLRGCIFRASRMNSRANGRIIIETQTCDLSKTHLPEPPDVTRCLAILWSLSSHDVSTPTRNPEKDMPRVSHRDTNSKLNTFQKDDQCLPEKTTDDEDENPVPA